MRPKTFYKRHLSARRLARLEDSARVRPGDVLILPSADPTWGLLIPWAGGIVLEIGMPSSTVAALARAWHVPCVVQTPGIWAALQDGQSLVIDGTVGRVLPSSE